MACSNKSVKAFRRIVEDKPFNQMRKIWDTELSEIANLNAGSFNDLCTHKSHMRALLVSRADQRQVVEPGGVDGHEIPWSEADARIGEVEYGVEFVRPIEH